MVHCRSLGGRCISRSRLAPSAAVRPFSCFDIPDDCGTVPAVVKRASVFSASPHGCGTRQAIGAHHVDVGKIYGDIALVLKMQVGSIPCFTIFSPTHLSCGAPSLVVKHPKMGCAVMKQTPFGGIALNAAQSGFKPVTLLLRDVPGQA